MVRLKARIDVAQPAIVTALREVGASVQSLASLGKGVPDLLVYYRGTLYLLEVKTSPADRLTPDEARWHHGWGGIVWIVRSAEDALHAIGAAGRKPPNDPGCEK